MNSQKGAGMPLTIVIIAFALVVAGVVYYAVEQQSKQAGKTQEEVMMKKDDTMMEKKEEGGIMEKEGDMMGKEDGEAMMEKDVMMMKYSGKVLAGKSAPLIDFVKTDYDTAVKSDKLVVLYFYANWCPICKEEVAGALYPAFNELTTDKVIGIRINYNDNETDNDEKNLAREYGIAYQHTKVFLKNGARVLKSPESWDKSRYLNEINKALGQ